MVELPRPSGSDPVQGSPGTTDATGTTDPTDPTDQFFKTTVPWLTQTRRAYLYRACLAIGTLLVLIGKASNDDVMAIIGVVGLFLGTGTATVYTTLPD